MIDADLYWPVLHVGLENPWFVVSLLLTHTIERFWRLIRTSLRADCRCRVVCLVELRLVLMSWIARSFGHGPVRLVLVDACKGTLFGVVRSRANDLRGGVKLNERVKTLDSSPSIKTVFRLLGDFRLQTWLILRSWSHLVLLLLRWKLNNLLLTLESPPNRVFPLYCLRTLSA